MVPVVSVLVSVWVVVSGMTVPLEVWSLHGQPDASAFTIKVPQRLWFVLILTVKHWLWFHGCSVIEGLKWYFSHISHIRSSFSVTEQQNICAFCGSRTWFITLKVVVPTHTLLANVGHCRNQTNSGSHYQQLNLSPERRDVSGFQLTTSWMITFGVTLVSLCTLG